MSPLLDYAEGAKVLGVSKSTLTKWVSAGKVPHYKIGSHVRFRREHLEEFIRTCERRPLTKSR